MVHQLSACDCGSMPACLVHAHAPLFGGRLPMVAGAGRAATSRGRLQSKRIGKAASGHGDLLTRCQRRASLGGPLCHARCTFLETARNRSAWLSQDLQQRFMKELLVDALKFGGAVIIRRLVGMAHTVDMEAIPDADSRCGTQSPSGRWARVPL